MDGLITGDDVASGEHGITALEIAHQVVLSSGPADSEGRQRSRHLYLWVNPAGLEPASTRSESQALCH